MLEYDRIDGSEWIDVNKTNDSSEYIICHYWYFLEINLRLQLKVRNVYHDIMQKGTHLKYFSIASVKESFIEFTFCMSKDESIILLRNVDLTKKVAYYKI